MQSAGGGLRVSDESRALPRTLGPLAWCALEILVERAERGDELVVDASVRSLATELGVAKNTAHRALAALTHAGIVSAVQHRDGAGRFNNGRYHLHLHDLIVAATPKPPRRAKAPVTASEPAQLSLLDPV